MATTVFPVASSAVTTNLNTSYLNATATNQGYSGSGTFDPATYQITCTPSTSVASVVFSNSSGVLATAITSSGTTSDRKSTRLNSSH